jgi:HGF/MSP/plasminogen-like protein
LSAVDEPGSAAHSVQEIILHPDWNYESIDFDADISVLVLRDPVEFTDNVQPICLPQPSDDEVARKGFTVGWSLSKQSEATGEDFDLTPNELEVLAVNNSDCIKAVRKVETPSSNRNFCAGFVNESKSACGGGFYLLDSSTKGFSLQGIVSASAKGREHPTHGCDINVYTNVAKFIDWIRSEMEKSKEVKWEEVEFECKPWLWLT